MSASAKFWSSFASVAETSPAIEPDNSTVTGGCITESDSRAPEISRPHIVSRRAQAPHRADDGRLLITFFTPGIDGPAGTPRVLPGRRGHLVGHAVIQRSHFEIIHAVHDPEQRHARMPPFRGHRCDRPRGPHRPEVAPGDRPPSIGVRPDAPPSRGIAFQGREVPPVRSWSVASSPFAMEAGSAKEHLQERRQISDPAAADRTNVQPAARPMAAALQPAGSPCPAWRTTGAQIAGTGLQSPSPQRRTAPAAPWPGTDQTASARFLCCRCDRHRHPAHPADRPRRPGHPRSQTGWRLPPVQDHGQFHPPRWRYILTLRSRFRKSRT